MAFHLLLSKPKYMYMLVFTRCCFHEWCTKKNVVYGKLLDHKIEVNMPK